MAKVLTDELIPSLKDKIGSSGSNSNLKVYAIAPDSNGVYNIVDSTLPSTPVEGMQFILRPTTGPANGGVPKISVNGSSPLGINRQHINNDNPARVEMSTLTGSNHYWIVWANGYWRCLNVPATVDAKDADVAGIMNSAGNNGQLFGLGGETILITGSNLNNLQRKTGFYKGSNLTNAPNNNLDWWYIEQIVHNSGWVLQRATYLKGTNDIYHRVLIEGAWSAWQRIMTSVNTLNQVYPVGSLFMSFYHTTPEAVASAVGGGTWVRTFKGRAIVGVDEAQTEFANSNAGGGSKTVTLTEAQMPSHTHALVNGTNGYIAHINNVAIFPTSDAKLYPNTQGGTLEWAKYVSLPATGGGQAHNNLQPYANIYIYTRTV